MDKREKARSVIKQNDGVCMIQCGAGTENECPAWSVCKIGIYRNETAKNACRAFLSTPQCSEKIDMPDVNPPKSSQPTKTLLDEFAMAAMEGSDLAIWKINGAGGLADNCYNVAAAMMKERARRDEMGNVKEVE